jgi:hypothetical protein
MARTRFASLLLPFFGSALLLGCPEESIDPLEGGGGQGGAGTGGMGTGGMGAAGGGGSAPTDKWPLLGCDPLVPEKCGYPFPSNVYTVADPASETGRRVSFEPDFFTPSKQGYTPLTNPWAKSDGFSPGSAILAYLPGAVDTGLPGVDQIEETILASSPTVLLDMATGELVPHWTEVDHSTPNADQRAILIHPAVPLKDGARYAVAIRGIEDSDGTVIAPSPAFAALRDGGTFDHTSIEARRGLYQEIFTALDAAGVAKADLQLAWDFTTASRENNTGWLLHMRDEAFELVGEDGPAYTISNVQTDFDPSIAFKIEGTMEVPLYLDQAGPGATLQFGADGMPEPNATMQTYEVEWELLIPQSALTTPAKIVQYGHGLLGSRTQIESGHFRTFMNTYNYALFSVNLVGLAEDDEGWIAARIAAGQTDELAKMMDRLHQGFLNNLMGMRLMITGMDQDPTYGAYLDGSQRYYWGISQGGIMGGVLMSVSTDVERGVLEVMGQPYNTLLNRSVDFEPFFQVMGVSFPDGRDQQIFLGLTQMLWDRVEPNGYTKYAVTDKLPGSPDDRRILMRVALGDHQVTTFGGHVMARAMNAKHVTTGLRDVWGLEAVTGPVNEPGATYFEYDFGLPPEPLCNVPMSLCSDPHGELRKLDEARAQVNEFFVNGGASNTCPGGVCTHPELSGCTGMEDPNLCD